MVCRLRQREAILVIRRFADSTLLQASWWNKRNIVTENARLPRKNADKRYFRCCFLEPFQVSPPLHPGRTLATVRAARTFISAKFRLKPLMESRRVGRRPMPIQETTCHEFPSAENKHFRAASFRGVNNRCCLTASRPDRKIVRTCPAGS